MAFCGDALGLEAPAGAEFSSQTADGDTWLIKCNATAKTSEQVAHLPPSQVQSPCVNFQCPEELRSMAP